MKSIGEMNPAELAAYVQQALRERGISVVLTGGAVVSIYSGEKYVSLDLDLVVEQYARRKTIDQVMGELGFRQAGRRFEHPETRYLVEFPAGPLSVGSEPVSRIDELILTTGKLRLLSPTDCVKDRLAAYYHWNDQQCLVQAMMVVKDQIVDMEELSRWSEVEGKLAEFEEIRDRLGNKGD